jgi:Ser/Thr protein kinase RdoA (MazF antagonist)
MIDSSNVPSRDGIPAFIATDSILNTRFLIEGVLSLYALEPISRCRLHARGLNDTYKVETAGGWTHYLRVYRAGWRDRLAIETEIDMLLHLTAQNVRVSAPVARIDGQFITALDCVEGRRWAVLFTAAPGKELGRKGYTEELASSYGEAAAAIHSAANSFEGLRHRPAIDLEHLLQRPLRLLKSVLAHRPADVDYIEDLGKRLKCRIEDIAEPEIGFCHGDLHGANASESGGSFTTFDFDCCGWGYRAYDLAVFPWGFAFDECETQRIEAMGRALLRGYMRHRPLGRRDVEAIPAFVAVREIWLRGLHIGLGDRFGWGWMSDGYYDHHLRMLRAWDTQFLTRPGADWLLAAPA